MEKTNLVVVSLDYLSEVVRSWRYILFMDSQKQQPIALSR